MSFTLIWLKTMGVDHQKVMKIASLSSMTSTLILGLIFFQKAVCPGIMAADAGGGNSGPQPQLDQVLSINLKSLADTPGKTWNYVPSAAGLGTDTAVWTWPVNLSCVGAAS